MSTTSLGPPPQKPDRVTIWPLDDARFGVDVTYEGASGYELATRRRSTIDTDP